MKAISCTKESRIKTIRSIPYDKRVLDEEPGAIHNSQDESAIDALLQLQNQQRASVHQRQQVLQQGVNRVNEQHANNFIPAANHVQPPQAQGDVAQLIQAMTALMNQNATLIQNSNAQRQGVLHYNVLPDLSHNIADFDGLSGATSARVWIKQLESTVTLHRWTEAVAFGTARSHLTRAAKNWYLGNLDTITNWQQFRQAFANTFLVQKMLTERFQEM